MLKLVVQLSVFMGISLFSWADTAHLSHAFIQTNASRALTVVEVTAALRGSGVLIQLDNKLAIITNSHNLQGRTEAQVFFPTIDISAIDKERGEWLQGKVTFKAVLPVIYDNPLYDFALLSLENVFEKILYQKLKYLAAFNGQLCREISGCAPGWHQPSGALPSPESNLAVVLAGKQLVIPLVEGTKAKLVEDNVISGDSVKIYSLPAYSRPGISGGAYYESGFFKGLLTKVSLSGSPETYAMPTEVIGKIINQPQKNEAYWQNGVLVIRADHDELQVKPAANGGGETSNGGGETSNGGGEISNGGDGPNSNTWNMSFYKIIGSVDVSTWNPFVRKTNLFELNGEEVAFIKVDNHYELPTLSRYRWNKKMGKKQITYSPTTENLALLEEIRRVQNRAPLCGRFSHYNKSQKTFNVQTGPTINGTDDSILFVLPDAKGKMPKHISAKNSWKDAFGWHRSFFTAAKFDADYFFYLYQTKFTFSFGSGKNDPEGVLIKVPDDLSHVSLNLWGLENELMRLPSKSANAILYSNADKRYKAAILYKVEDLSKLDRAYFLYDNNLLELGPCDNFAGVK